MRNVSALVIEDDEPVAGLNRRLLEREGFDVDVALTAGDGSRLAAKGHYDIILLDLALPDGNGIDLLRIIRERSDATQVLVVSGCGDAAITAGALDAGADDYIQKPYQTAALGARVRALMRRSPVPGPADIRCGNVTLSRMLRDATVAGTSLRLTAREYFLLEYLVTNRGRVVSRIELLEKVWTVDFDPGTNVIDVNVSRLRSKLSRACATCTLESERGSGYVLRSDD